MKIIAYGSGVAVAVMVARVLGPQERGVWSLALLLASMLALLADGGVSTSTLFLVRNRPDRVRAAVAMSVAIVVAGSLVLGSVVVVFGTVWSTRLLGIPPTALAIVGVLVPIFALNGLLRQLLTALGDLPGANANLFWQSLAVPAVVILMFLTGPPLAGWLLCGYLASIAGVLVISGVRLLRWIPPGPNWDRRLLGPMLQQGLTSQVATLTLILTYRSDLLLVGHWLGLGAAGVYSIGLTLSEILRGVPETAQALVVSHARKEDFRSYAGQVSRGAVLITGCLGLVAAVASPVLVPLVFGKAYQDAAVVFACLVPGVVALAVSYAISPLLFLEGRLAANAVAGLAALAVLWGFSLLAPFALSLQKVAIASTLAYWTLALTQVAYLSLPARNGVPALVPGRQDFTRLLGALGQVRWKRER